MFSAGGVFLHIGFEIQRLLSKILPYTKKNSQWLFYTKMFPPFFLNKIGYSTPSYFFFSFSPGCSTPYIQNHNNE